jgi:3-oxoacyl-(acyl-carrier-protein) synthase
MATAFMLHGREPTKSSRFTLESFAQKSDLTARIQARSVCTPDQFGSALDLRSTFKKVVTSGVPKGDLHAIREGNWYLQEINEKSQRLYAKRTEESLLAVPETLAATAAETSTGRLISVIPSAEMLVSGTSVILPTREGDPNNKNDSAIKRLVAGMNCVELFSEDDRLRMEAVNKTVDAATLPKMCAKVPDIDLVSDYGLSARMVRGCSKVTQIGIAAGLESLLSAGLVVPQKNESGGDAVTDWTLKEEYRSTTGIIMCCSFHGMDSTVDAVQNNDDGKAFDKKIVLRLLLGANAQLAQIVSATGPNTLLNASCASTTQAIGIASDWMSMDRCDRVLVVAAEDVTSDTLLPWIGNGFHALGATSAEGEIETALRPFDSGRSGLVLSSGAVGLVLEKEPSKKASKGATIGRTISPSSVQLLGAHYCNAAYHGTSLSEEFVTTEMDRFITQIEVKYNISRKDIATHGMYLSHETGTNGASAKAACAVTEMASLKGVFKEDVGEMLIVNSKGHTGHAMGVAFEDVIAVESLRSKQIPTIPHFKNMDSRLNPDEVKLCLDPNEDHSHVKYALHFAVGFGSQVAFSLFYSS